MLMLLFSWFHFVTQISYDVTAHIFVSIIIIIVGTIVVVVVVEDCR